MNQSFCAKLAYLNNKGSDKKKKKLQLIHFYYY